MLRDRHLYPIPNKCRPINLRHLFEIYYTLTLLMSSFHFFSNDDISNKIQQPNTSTVLKQIQRLCTMRYTYPKIGLKVCPCSYLNLSLCEIFRRCTYAHFHYYEEQFKINIVLFSTNNVISIVSFSPVSLSFNLKLEQKQMTTATGNCLSSAIFPEHFVVQPQQQLQGLIHN